MKASPQTEDILHGFISATEYTFATQCNLTVSAETPQEASGPGEPVDIAAVLSVDGLDRPLTVTLGFTKDTYLNIVNAMLGESHTAIEPSLTDPISELMNIIFGAARRDISGASRVAQKVIPTVILGKIEEIVPLSNCNQFCIPFQSPRGPFSLKLGLGVNVAMG